MKTITEFYSSPRNSAFGIVFLKFQYNDAEIPYPVHENSFPDFAWKQECVLIPGKAADNSDGSRKAMLRFL